MNSIPFVSILIPIRNEIKHIEHCLDAVLNQDYPAGKMEILIADGMSDDGTREILKLYMDQHSQIRVYDNPRKVVATGLNLLISQTKGEVLIRVDGHTIVYPDYVRNCVELLHTSVADNVGGRMDAKGENFIGNVVAIATSTPFGVGGARFHYSDQEEWVDTVYMGAWRREVFTKIGVFDEELVRNQDDEFNYRLRKFGGKILLSPSIKSCYTPRGSIPELWQQYFQYGFYKVRVLQKHPRQMSPRQFVPPLFVLSLLIFSILAFFFPWGLSALSGLVILYALANLITSLLVASREGWKYFFLLPLAFATLHLSYGTGFLMGLFRFWNRWRDPQGQVPEVKFD
ncbi:MAG: glycosyltransferase family 2 protein [Brevefilum sp.]|jgi:succinoglycan biosynthesis protein ExoA